jgi:hypothetical protein
VIPKYVKVKFGNSSPGAHVTTKKAQITLIKDEIKFLFKKKENLNYEHYKNGGECGVPFLDPYRSH